MKVIEVDKQEDDENKYDKENREAQIRKKEKGIIQDNTKQDNDEVKMPGKK